MKRLWGWVLAVASRMLAATLMTRQVLRAIAPTFAGGDFTPARAPGVALRAGHDVYVDSARFVYRPSAAVFFAPLSIVPLRTSIEPRVGLCGFGALLLLHWGT